MYNRDVTVRKTENCSDFFIKVSNGLKKYLGCFNQKRALDLAVRRFHDWEAFEKVLVKIVDQFYHMPVAAILRFLRDHCPLNEANWASQRTEKFTILLANKN